MLMEPMANASQFNCLADSSLAHQSLLPSVYQQSGSSSDFIWRHNTELNAALLPENLFGSLENALDENSFTALLGLPTSEAANLLQQTCSEAFSEDIMAGDWQQFEAQSGRFVAGGRGNGISSTAGIGPAACLPTFPSDPAFVERAAKFSSFANGDQMARAEESAPSTAETVSGNSKELTFAGEESAVSEIDAKSAKENRGRKRKTARSCKAANSELVKGKRGKGTDIVKENEESKDKVVRSDNCDNNSAESTPKQPEEKNTKAPASPEKQNYVHVRARRGQATDSHSLAERARREKISERMKLLQDLVPGCSKITGKAVMLEEIINHVQHLQSQVEFLSMKLATVNPRLDFDIDHFFAKEMMAPWRGISPAELTAPSHLQYQPQLEQSSLQTVTGCGSDVPSAAWENELKSAYNVGLLHAGVQSPFDSQAISCNFQISHLKRET